MSITKFKATDYIRTDDAHVSVHQGNWAFNSVTIKLLNLRNFQGMEFGHDSTEDRPDLMTKIYFIPSKSDNRTEVSFPFQKTKGLDNIRRCSSLHVVNQNPNLQAMSNHNNKMKRRLKIYYDLKEKLYCSDITPQFTNIIQAQLLNEIISKSTIYSLYSKEELVYYGETNDLKTRIKQHQDKEKIFDEVRFSDVKDDVKLRKYWERFFLMKWSEEHQGKLPLYNKVVPSEKYSNPLEILEINNRKVAVNETYSS